MRCFRAEEAPADVRAGFGIDNGDLSFKIGAATQMNTLRSALVPALISGVLSVFASWLWMAVVFHPFQRETPNTWRPEGPANYLGATVLRFLSVFGIAALFVLITRFRVSLFGIGIRGSLAFGFALWGALALPVILESALFIRLHRFVVLGQLLDWLTTLLVTCAITSWWLGR